MSCFIPGGLCDPPNNQRLCRVCCELLGAQLDLNRLAASAKDIGMDPSDLCHRGEYIRLAREKVLEGDAELREATSDLPAPLPLPHPTLHRDAPTGLSPLAGIGADVLRRFSRMADRDLRHVAAQILTLTSLLPATDTARLAKLDSAFAHLNRADALLQRALNGPRDCEA